MRTKPHSEGQLFVGLDIGNTRLTVGLADREGHLLAVDQRLAPKGATAAIPVLVDMATQAIEKAHAAQRKVAGLGLGFGGPVDYEHQVTRQSFHSPEWEGIALAKIFEDHFQIPALLDNDANAGGLGEALFGAAQGHQSVVYVNVGTGVGGAIIMDGKVHHGRTGSAGEIGHLVLDPVGPPCNCGKRGCVEALASGTAIVRMAREAGLEAPNGQAVAAAAQKGNKTAVSVLACAAHSLGLGIANVVNMLDPDIVVLGGGVPEAGEFWWKPLRESFPCYTILPAAYTTPLVPAILGYHAGVLGAAALGMAAADQLANP
ncbi:MAG: ROK family protein [Candidatus Zipacnadales bacterium]